MTFPFVAETGFELGTRGHFDAETDTETRLDFPHYSELARIPGLPAPYRGAYCMRVNLANDGTPADAYVQETGSWDIALQAAAMYWRFMIYVSDSITMADADEFAVWQLWSATNTVEAGCYINYTTANGLRLGLGKDTAAASVFLSLSTGKWHCVELYFTAETAADGTGNDALLDGYLDNAAFTQIAGTYDAAAITSGVLGVIAQDAGTTAGYVLFDDVLTDDTRLGVQVERFPNPLLMTVSGHALVGPGEITGVQLMSGAGTDNVVALYDTDTGYTTDPSHILLELKNTANSQVVENATPMCLPFKRGCYVSLSGTNPRALIHFKSKYQCDALIRNHGARRTPNLYGA